MVRKGDKANHKGSIVRWPKYKYVFDEQYNRVIRKELVGWNEDILLEPMDYQVLCTLDNGLMVLSADIAQETEVIDADLWDDSCDKKLEQIGIEFTKKYKNNYVGY